MPTRNIDPSNPTSQDDWVGNNAAFTCPVCEKVYVVSNGRMGDVIMPGHVEQGVRRCPNCDNSTARVTGGANGHPQTTASIEW